MEKSGKGQSLYEVIFAIAIATLILTGVVVLSTSAIRNSTYSKNKAEATKLAQQASEWLKEQKDTDWDNLATHLDDNRCLGELSWSGGCNVSGSIYDRRVTLTNIGGDIEAQVIVTWSDGLGDHQVKAITTYTNWKSL